MKEQTRVGLGDTRYFTHAHTCNMSSDVRMLTGRERRWGLTGGRRGFSKGMRSGGYRRLDFVVVAEDAKNKSEDERNDDE